MSSSRTGSGPSRYAGSRLGARAGEEGPDSPAGKVKPQVDGDTRGVGAPGVGSGGEAAESEGAVGGDSAGKKSADDKRGHTHVPFPADDIGKSRGWAAAANPPAEADGKPGGGSGGEPADSAVDGSADEATGSGGAGTAEILSGAAAALNGKLDTGRQAVKQAVAATNSWFTSRVTKNDERKDGGSAAPESSAAREEAPVAAGQRKPSFTPATDHGPDREDVRGLGRDGTANPGTGRSLWRDTYAPPQAPAEPKGPWSSSSSWTQSHAYAHPPGVAPNAPGVAPNAPGVAPNAPGMAQPPGVAPNAPGSGVGMTGPAAGAAAHGASRAAAAPSPPLAPAGWQTRYPSSRHGRAPARHSRRQAHLTVARVEPWSVMKFSFMISVVAFIILFVAVAVLYMALSALGVFTSLQHTVSSITSSQGSAGTNVRGWFSASRVLGYTGMLGALNIVLITAMSTIGAVIYNLVARVVGGVEVTLRETE